MLAAALSAGVALAQDGQAVASSGNLPASWHLTGIQHIYQGWNNCGPATLTMGLTYFGFKNDQYPAAQWLKPNSEDKNVSPWQIVEYVNNQIGGTVKALVRQGGTLDRLKQLISQQFRRHHRRRLRSARQKSRLDGALSAALRLRRRRAAVHVAGQLRRPERHAFPTRRKASTGSISITSTSCSTTAAARAELMALLGDDADARQNSYNALVQATNDARANGSDPFAWFNIGTNYVALGDYDRAAAAYDQARNLGLPWRMMWYQFGPFEAYYHMERYQDMIDLAQANLNDGGGQYVEETFYYGGLAREGLGENDRALCNFNGALSFNPNFTPARDRP